MKYDFSKIEKRWQKKWREERIYEPDFGGAKQPFYNLMMFPYPSAEGLHVGNVYAFVGSDIYGRYKRMQGSDVFEPIGLDGFGIHSENYALKIGAHPMERAKVSGKRFYEQLEAMGNSFAWDERLQTYDPGYYKWTQWIFTQMFKNGLAYRKKQAVNWCPSCKTVLADEQAASGECERCGTTVVKKELEQWFFRITKYADRLLKNLETLDWSEKVKIAQRNWIGKSEGAEIDFEIRTKEKPNFVLLHGYAGSPKYGFFPWLKGELEKRGYKVQLPPLPHSDKSKANEKDDIAALWKKAKFDSNTILLGHSLGAVVAMKAVEKLNHPIRKLVLAGGFIKPEFGDHPRQFESAFSWKFDFKKIKKNAGAICILHDVNDSIVPRARATELQKALGVSPVFFSAQAEHICGKKEPAVLKNVLDTATVFTTRPDTLFGATYLVLSPEHPLVNMIKRQITNQKQVDAYIKKARAKSEDDRTAEGQEKTGVELEGVKAVNPANGEEIPVWVADYVLGSYGTGAIMAVPAHDERDWGFAKRYKLPIRRVVLSAGSIAVYPDAEKGGRRQQEFLEEWNDHCANDGVLVNSGKFFGMRSAEARRTITEFVGGVKRTQYRLRDWLISRQRYWGPPIPIIYCRSCWEAKSEKGGAGNMQEGIDYAVFDGKEYVIHAVPDGDLPVKLPYIKDFRPRGKGASPLASAKSFYETKCPHCGGMARRETDVSDTFLDSAWYYIGYLMAHGGWRVEMGDSQFKKMAQKWLPVDSYIGGAEHSVLHLLYSRFVAMALHDWGVVDFSAEGVSATGGDEPFTKFRAHGLLIKEGAKMSKSKGNVVNPDEYIKKFGADVLRMYLMFLAPFDQGGDFRDAGILGLDRFLRRVWTFFSNKKFSKQSKKGQEKKRQEATSKKEVGELERAVHRAIKKITEDIEGLRYNTAISQLMVLLNKMEEEGATSSRHDACLVFLKMLAPFAPHIAEEIWRNVFGNETSIHVERWPSYDKKLAEEVSFTLVIQVNGKVRDLIDGVPAGISESEAKELAFGRERVRAIVGDRNARKVIYISGRLINIVI